MRIQILAVALMVGASQTALAAESRQEPPALQEAVRGASQDQQALETPRFGLTGPISASTFDRLRRGDRTPVIVMMTEPKAAPASALRTEDALDARRAAIAEARTAALFGAFGANGFTRADDLERRDQSALGRALRPSVLTEFEVTPGFTVLASANEIARLRATPGVVAVYEDTLSEQVLDDTTLLTGAQTAWSSSIEGAGAAVAILDSGVELEHPMTSAAITASACFNQIVPGTSSSFCPGGAAQVTSLTSGSAGDSCIEDNIDPVNGVDGCFHGTHVGSTAAGRTVSLSSGPISGVARQADIIAVNVFARFEPSICGGSSQCIRSWTSDQIAALDWLLINRVSLDLAAVNMSLGGGRNFSACDGGDPRTTVINNLRAAGVATVIASGNDGWSDSVSTPGCISSAITVGSTTKSDAVSGFSNSSSLVDLMAPGSGILAAWQSEEPAPGANCIAAGTPRAPGPDGFCHWYSTSSGTSMATPHVAGAFAMLKAAFPAATVTDIETALESTGVSIFDSRNGLTIPRIQIDAAAAVLAGGSAGPANNDFADRITVSGSNVTTTGNNSGADKEPGEPNHARPGGASVWWSWTAPANGAVTVDTAGSNYDTMLGVYTGSAVNALTTIGTNDDAPGLGLRSRVQFTASSGVTYQIAVDGYNAFTGDITLNISQ